MGYLDKLRVAKDSARAAVGEVRRLNEQIEAQELWLADKSLRGPAGRYVYGQHLSKADREAQRQPLTLAPDAQAQARAEWEMRVKARAPYVAPDRPTVRITRIPSRESTQVEDVARHLAASGLAARPDLVFGVYRVPDHIGSGFSRDRYVEWEIVHGDLPTSTPAGPPEPVWFDADSRWVARRLHEPMVFDEELALAYLADAGIGPEQTLGISRFVTTHPAPTSDESTSLTASYITGLHVWHPQGAGGGARDRLTAQRPLTLGEPPARIEVLNWAGIRKAVAPDTGKSPESPSPFPYLPSTAQEVLASYLEIVGVRAADCYAAAVTEDVPRDLNSVSRHVGMTLTRNLGDRQPCVDGERRSRLRGGSRIVVVHRDAPDYEAGRERFAAYEDQVLQSRLHLGAERRPLEFDDLLDHLPRGLRGMAKATTAVARFVTAETYDDLEKRPPFRYCWPPIDRP